VLALAEAGPGTRTLSLPGGGRRRRARWDEISFYVPAEVPSGEEPLRKGPVAFGGWTFRVEWVGRYDGRDAGRPGVAYLDPGGGLTACGRRGRGI
jgi:hypothetical protein